MKTLSIALLSAFIGLANLTGTFPSATYLTTARREAAQTPDNSVLLCMGGSSQKYHKRANCTGLNRCSTSLKPVSLTEAITIHNRTACKKCIPQ